MTECTKVPSLGQLIKMVQTAARIPQKNMRTTNKAQGALPNEHVKLKSAREEIHCTCRRGN